MGTCVTVLPLVERTTPPLLSELEVTEMGGGSSAVEAGEVTVSLEGEVGVGGAKEVGEGRVLCGARLPLPTDWMLPRRE